LVLEPEEPPSAPPLLPPTPVLPDVPLPDVPVPDVLGLVVPGLAAPLLPMPDVPVLLLPVVLLPLLPRRSWRWQSSFAIPVSTSQRLEPELLEPLVLGLALELELPVVSVLLGLELLPLAPVLLLSLLELELLLGLELEPLVLGLVVEELPPRLGLVVELPVDPPALLPLEPEVWAMETLATPRNAAATAAQSTLVFICAPKGIGEMLPPTASSCYARSRRRVVAATNACRLGVSFLTSSTVTGQKRDEQPSRSASKGCTVAAVRRRYIATRLSGIRDLNAALAVVMLGSHAEPHFRGLPEGADPAPDGLHAHAAPRL
jgi:hypothetical protein